jgi:hypothetical protein
MSSVTLDGMPSLRHGFAKRLLKPILGPAP